jgi:hypothetical protein
MDDVEDNSELRRGIPVAHTIYGVPQTINTANYVYFLAMKELGGLGGVGKGKGKEEDLTGLVTGESLRSCFYSSTFGGFSLLKPSQGCIVAEMGPRRAVSNV